MPRVYIPKRPRRTPNPLGDELIEIRKRALKMTLTELSCAIGWSTSAINYIECGKRLPTIEFLVDLARLAGDEAVTPLRKCFAQYESVSLSDLRGELRVQISRMLYEERRKGESK